MQLLLGKNLYCHKIMTPCNLRVLKYSIPRSLTITGRATLDPHRISGFVQRAGYIIQAMLDFMRCCATVLCATGVLTRIIYGYIGLRCITSHRKNHDAVKLSNRLQGTVAENPKLLSFLMQQDLAYSSLSQAFK